MQPPPNYSNYYRSPQGAGYGPAEVDFNAISVAWNMITKELGLWVPTSLLCMIILYVVNFGLSFAMQMLFLGSVYTLRPPTTVGALLPFYAVSVGVGMITNAIVMVLNAGIMNMAYMKLEGRQVGIGDLFSGFNCFLPIIGAGFLMAIMQTLGLILFIIPGLYLYGALAFAPMIVIRQNKSPIEAISLSLKVLSGGKGFMMFLLLLVAGILSGLGVFACCVGVIFTFPIIWLTVGITYFNFFPPQVAPASSEGMPPMPGPEIPRQ